MLSMCVRVPGCQLCPRLLSHHQPASPCDDAHLPAHALARVAPKAALLSGGPASSWKRTVKKRWRSPPHPPPAVPSRGSRAGWQERPQTWPGRGACQRRRQRWIVFMKMQDSKLFPDNRPSCESQLIPAKRPLGNFQGVLSTGAGSDILAQALLLTPRAASAIRLDGKPRVRALVSASTIP